MSKVVVFNSCPIHWSSPICKRNRRLGHKLTSNHVIYMYAFHIDQLTPNIHKEIESEMCMKGLDVETTITLFIGHCIEIDDLCYSKIMTSVFDKSKFSTMNHLTRNEM